MDCTGQRFLGYELERFVGSGGSGEVYEARDRGLGRRVALRIVPRAAATDALTRARLNREALAHAAVNHPNVLPIYEVGEHEGSIYIVRRWVDGVSLDELVRQTGPLDPRRAVVIVDQVASALDTAHAEGVMHRSVKPSSVLVTAADRVYLTGFQLARHATDPGGLTVQEHLLGNFDYVAPEHIEGTPADARVDIYGLGCLLYEALTAQAPYPDRRPAAKLYAHASSSPPSPRALRPALPQPLDDVVTTALRKDPDERQQSAAELAIAAAKSVGLAPPLWAGRDAPPSPAAVPAPAATERRAGTEPPADMRGPRVEMRGPRIEMREPRAEVRELAAAGLRPRGDVHYYGPFRRRARPSIAWLVGALAFLAAPALLALAVLT